MPPYTILIRDAVKTFLLSRSTEEKEEFKRQFDKLGTGVLPDSLQVKRNSGSITVLEGQLPNNIHIILTLGKQADDEQRRLIYVWYVWRLTDVQKDDDPDDPSFLKNRPNSGFSIDRLEESDYHSEDEIARKCKPQRWYELNKRNWQRILEGRPELELWLDSDEKIALEKPLPILLSGTSGSGKTTVSIYRLLKEYLNQSTPHRLLYITYNEGLKKHAKELFEGLLLKDELKDGEVENIFRTYRELCLELLPDQPKFKKFNEEWREITFLGIYPELQSKIIKKELGSIDPTLVWEEIRSNIKGSKHILEHIGNLENGLLSWGAYQNISEYPREVRNKIYDIAQEYQSDVLGDKYWDEIDLAREAYRAVKSSQNLKKYDLIVCDEVQDLTELQVALLFEICENPNNLFFTGDEHQIINPSGFRWENIQAFWQNPPEISYLKYNHRSAGEIVKLSNELLKLKHELLNLRTPQQTERWGGEEKPYVIQNAVEWIIEENAVDQSEHNAGLPRADRAVLQCIQPGADRAILVRTREEQGRLKGTGQVFTIYEAKGLEWDTILLWKFFQGKTFEFFQVGIGSANITEITEGKDITHIWQRILRGNPRNLSKSTIDHEISLLYVCLTRARVRLFIYDGEAPGQLWHDERFKSFVQGANSEYFRGVWQKLSTGEEWLKQGRYLLERNRYEQAASCFKHALEYFRKDDVHYHESLALYHESLARHHEACKEWDNAAIQWKDAGQISLERDRHDQAAHYFKQAASCFKRAGNDMFHHESLARHHEACKEWDNAAIQWEKAGQTLFKMLADAAGKDPSQLPSVFRSFLGPNLFVTLGNIMNSFADQYKNAARCWENAKQYHEARRCWHWAGEPGEVLRCEAKILRQEANELEQKGSYDKAIEKYREAAQKMKDYAQMGHNMEAQG